MSDLILYTTEDAKSQIKLRALEQTVWLTQLEIAELFDATKQNISLHIKNLFEDGELDPEATVKESLTVQIEGSREVQRTLTLYNLDASRRGDPASFCRRFAQSRKCLQIRSRYLGEIR